MDYKFFIDPNTKTSKYLIYKCDSLPIEIMLATNQMHANSIENYNVCIEKHKSMNLIQIRLSNLRDNTSVFICTIDQTKFEQFKLEQMLLVSFEAFVNLITEMMEKCRNKTINISLKEDHPSPNQMYQLQFYEKGTFKNLIHISLPVIPAPFEVILFQINQTYAHLQDENRILMQKNAHFKTEMTQKSDQIEHLNCVINGMRTTLNDQEKIIKESYKERLLRLENDIKSAHDAKKYQTQEFEKQITSFKTQIENLLKENTTLCEQLKIETSLNAQLRADGKKALKKINELNKQLECQHNEQFEQQNLMQKNSEIVIDLQKQINEHQQRIAMYEKQLQDIMAELQAEKNVCQIKKDGLKIATEDICNANTIIRRQAAEIEALRKKVNLRTEVALKQENIIRQSGNGKGKGKENIENLIEKIDEDMERIIKQNQETQNKIESIRDRTNTLECKYRDRIDDLYDQIQLITVDNQSMGIPSNGGRRTFAQN